MDENTPQTNIGTAFAWILLLVGLVATATMFVILDQVMNNYLIPAFGNVAIFSLNATQNATYTTQVNEMLSFWSAVPYIIFIILIISGLIVAYVGTQARQ